MTLDVVIPSLRLDPFFLMPLLNVRLPEGVAVHFYLVVDDPSMAVPSDVIRRAERGDVTILMNETNLGAGGSRNRGFDAGTGDLVLFLDDDVRPAPYILIAYVDAARKDGLESPGYVGVTRFPPPCNGFTRGVVASDILTFFDIASTRAFVNWGVSANLCLRRKAMGSHRFSPKFPRAGGGEDIDLCLRVVLDADGRPFKCVPSAEVTHPWWHGGRRAYLRFGRWAFGDSVLPAHFPRFRYANLPTLPEMILALVGLAVMIGISGHLSFARFALVMFGAVLVDLGVDYAKLRLRGACSPVTSIEASLVRFSNDLGRLLGNALAWFRPARLPRFDYFCTGEAIGYERRVASTKFAGWMIVVLLGISIGPH